MDYEKKYKEAINRAKAMVKVANSQEEIYNSVITIFPELKESEDKMIREYLTRYIDNTMKSSELKSKLLAWLEKQGEQKPFDYENANIQQNDFAPKVEPKFKVGNWYQCTKDFFGKGVTFDKNTAYYCAKEGCLQCEYGCHIAIVKNLYDNFKLWTIQDAEDGDVLAFDNNTIVIFKDLYNATTFHSYCHIEDGLFGVSKDEMPDWWEGKGFHPATKEQRDLLFAKMKESGYEWLEETKELKKIEQKSAWSEEDEKMVANLVDYFKVDDALQYTEKQVVDWLKSLKGRAQPQPKQEWSEEDQNALEDVREAVVHYWGGETQDILLYWLKSIKQRIKGE